jgi:pSer/pThr/pTyr-binding forkhead associated (FHA) protein/Mg-chelatase subunit ChlD
MWKKIAMMLSLLLLASYGFTENLEQAAVGQENTGMNSSPPAKQSQDLMLVIDNSGSMKKNDPQFLTKEVVTGFLKTLNPSCRIGMILFGENIETSIPLFQIADSVQRAAFLESLSKIDYTGKRTNSPAAVEKAIYDLKMQAEENAQKVIIFMTDGIVDTGDKNKDIEKTRWLREDLTASCKQAGIKIIGIAFTDEADFSLIQSLGVKTGGEYYKAYSAQDIKPIFDKISELLSKQSEEEKPASPQKSPKPQTITVAQTPEPQGMPTMLIVLVIAVILGLSAIIIFVVTRSKSSSQAQPDVLTPENIEPVRIPKAELIDLGKITSVEKIAINKQEIRIGRGNHNDLVINECSVSNDHAIIMYKNGAFYLEDQRSTYGTSLNGNKIESEKQRRLKNGDKIEFHTCLFRFSLPGQDSPNKTRIEESGEAGGGGNIQQPVASGSETPVEPKHAPGNEPAPEQPKVSPNQKENETLLIGMCSNHKSLKATEICSRCKKIFCERCVYEKDGKIFCHGCSKEM